MKTCRTCPNTLSRVEVGNRVVRCAYCRGKRPGVIPETMNGYGRRRLALAKPIVKSKLTSFWITAPRENFTQLASQQEFSQARLATPYPMTDS